MVSNGLGLRMVEGFGDEVRWSLGPARETPVVEGVPFENVLPWRGEDESASDQ